VVLGGIIIVASILAILIVIAAEVYPLFTPPAASMVKVHAVPLPGESAPGEAIGVDEYREVGYVISRRGTVEFVPLRGERLLPPAAVADLGGASITGATGTPGTHLLGTSDGRVVPVRVTFETAFDSGVRTVNPVAEFGAARSLDPERRRAIGALAFAETKAGPITAARVGPTEVILLAVVEKKGLIGGARREESTQVLDIPTDGEVTALRMDGRADDLFVGTSRGEVIRYDLRDRANPVRAEGVPASVRAGAAVTVLGFLNGDRTLVVGDAVGGVTTWQVVAPSAGADRRLVRMHEFARHAGPVVGVSASRRDKGFATADATGRVAVHYGTSGRTLLTMQTGGGQARAVVFAPKADGVLAVDGRGGLVEWRLDNPHPEVTLKTLFGKVWYEGYAKPTYVWQSTGGTDDFEGKFSLTPLVFGTLKGTFYALFFAAPMALLAALYVSEFMHPAVKGYVKPAVEVMAALPSVVLGFLAGLWLAPVIERVVPGLVLFPVVMPVIILATLGIWRTLPGRLRGRFKSGTEAFLLVPVIGLGAWLAFALGEVMEATALGGSYRTWLLSAAGITYDQRNSLVVGVAMGFAVIPIIFTIAEDSLANVPQHLRAGSLALGATRWQTAVRVVLPTASPGIFSAMMIGLGRAVGETMIVLMATGNTPVMDWSAFNGFRALSANIAVELPEAPEGGTLFRVLFLAAFLLFCLTFAVNTAAELVRLKLRRKYRYL
jgi:phosphate transport system permease protein